ncbi:hypothetical protein AAZX31_13G244500 [Glycine max]
MNIEYRGFDPWLETTIIYCWTHPMEEVDIGEPVEPSKHQCVMAQ